MSVAAKAAALGESRRDKRKYCLAQKRLRGGPPRAGARPVAGRFGASERGCNWLDTIRKVAHRSAIGGSA